VAQVASEAAGVVCLNPTASRLRRYRRRKLFAAALGFKGTEAESLARRVFGPKWFAAASLPTHPIADYRAIIIDNLSDFDPAGH